MAEMTMIECADGRILWECSACLKEIKDSEGFEDVIKTCPKCGAKITQFFGLYDSDYEDNDDE